MAGYAALATRLLWVVSIAAFALAIDQISKWLVVEVVLRPEDVVSVLPFLNLRLVFNEGLSFGMLGEAMAGRAALMATLTGLVTVLIAVWAMRAQHLTERIGLSLVVGGSLGNIADRLRQGSVTDFIDLRWSNWAWPTFNFADIAIVLGSGLFVFATMRLRIAEEA